MSRGYNQVFFDVFGLHMSVLYFGLNKNINCTASLPLHPQTQHAFEWRGTNNGSLSATDCPFNLPFDTAAQAESALHCGWITFPVPLSAYRLNIDDAIWLNTESEGREQAAWRSVNTANFIPWTVIVALITLCITWVAINLVFGAEHDQIWSQPNPGRWMQSADKPDLFVNPILPRVFLIITI